MKKLTREQFLAMEPLEEEFEWWCENCERLETVDQIRRIMEEDYLFAFADPPIDFANWIIVRVMEPKQYIAYAHFAAAQAEELKKVINEDSWYSKAAARAVARSLEAAASAAKGDDESTRLWAEEAYKAAVWAALYHAKAKGEKFSIFYKEMGKKILEYGISLLEGK